MTEQWSSLVLWAGKEKTVVMVVNGAARSSGVSALAQLCSPRRLACLVLLCPGEEEATDDDGLDRWKDLSLLSPPPARVPSLRVCMPPPLACVSVSVRPGGVNFCTDLQVRDLEGIHPDDLATKMLQFLMGLNELFSPTRGQILLMTPLPSVNQAYAMILEDESQRHIANSTTMQPIEGVAMLGKGRGRGRGRGRGSSPVECSHCRKKGHSKDNCFQLVGYPAEFKGNRSKSNQEVSVNQTEVEVGQQPETITHSVNTVSLSFTLEQYEKLLELLRKESESGIVHALIGTGLTTSVLYKNAHTHWVIDSGATTHMVGDLSLLNSYKEYIGPIKSIKIPNGQRVPMTHALQGGRMMGTGKVAEGLYLLKLNEDHEHRIRSDNGTEFINNDLKCFLREKGIVHETSCPYTPEQNGIVERKHRTLIQVARGLIIQSGVPINYWGECVKMACFLVNRLPSKILKFQTPYEIVYGKIADYTNLRAFGCLAYAIDLVNVDKFKPRSLPCVFLGYPNNQKGFVLLNLHNRDIFVGRHVNFIENKFPFKDAMSMNQGGVSKYFREMFMFDPKDTPITLEINKGNDSKTEYNQQRNNDVCVEDNTSPSVESQSQNHAAQPSTRPTKDKRPPIWAQDYICNLVSTRPNNNQIGKGNCRYPIEKYMSYENISSSYLCFLCSIDSISEPQSYKEAVKDINWVKAMKEEIEALEHNKTWELVKLPRGKQTIGCKWVYKVKYKPNGTINKYKARLVAKGYTQREGIDFHETFSPVVKMI
ncbi:uncharacterized protein LOC114736223 [Neltuma alba]|uniref:uncharacterized protein LOC114736223 n=1 Tax=Neltuma alba TaxID=207710 RepID=UPI0010A341AA|nr:uncharacterized protein LOC114736223 [Prosopis alba]